MQKFYPHYMIRWFSGCALILLLVVLPALAGFWGANISIPGEGRYFLLGGVGMSLVGFAVIQYGFWEKCFSHLELSEREIRWKCPLRRDRVIPASRCVEIGAYVENEGNGVPSEQIYFSDHPNPKGNMGKNGVIKASKHLIKFFYDEQLCKYLLKTYSGKQTSCLSAYRQRRKRW